MLSHKAKVGVYLWCLRKTVQSGDHHKQAGGGLFCFVTTSGVNVSGKYLICMSVDKPGATPEVSEVIE
jgi:hypothetical protein